MLKIVAISDLHGHLPNIPECDLLLIAGDLCPAKDHTISFQEYWLDSDFRYWLRDVPSRKTIYIAGNHDFIFENAPHRVPKNLRATYLQDSGTEFEGIKIWGTPWQPVFHWWAFNAEEVDLKKKWALIPDDTDILVVHGPPHGFHDLVPRRINPKNETEWPAGEHCGSPSLLERINEINPKLVVCGHIHRGRGVRTWGDTTIANVTVVNEAYKLVYEPWVYEWKDDS